MNDGAQTNNNWIFRENHGSKPLEVLRKGLKSLTNHIKIKKEASFRKSDAVGEGSGADKHPYLLITSLTLLESH